MKLLTCSQALVVIGQVADGDAMDIFVVKFVNPEKVRVSDGMMHLWWIPGFGYRNCM